jgi:di/tricarboxylate transporter
MTQTEKRWKCWLAPAVLVNIAFSIFCLLYFIFGTFKYMDEPIPWFVIGLFVACVAMYCLSFGNMCSIVASAKNRDPRRFFLLGALLGIIGLIVTISVPTLNQEVKS